MLIQDNWNVRVCGGRCGHAACLCGGQGCGGWCGSVVGVVRVVVIDREAVIVVETVIKLSLWWTGQ